MHFLSTGEIPNTDRTGKNELGKSIEEGVFPESSENEVSDHHLLGFGGLDGGNRGFGAFDHISGTVDKCEAEEVDEPIDKGDQGEKRGDENDRGGLLDVVSSGL